MIKLKNFINRLDQQEILNWINDYSPSSKEIENKHIKEINSAINGFSVLYDFTNTDISRTVSKFQGDNTVIDQVPEFFVKIKDKIAKDLNINKDHVFGQMIKIGSGGQVKPHYDASAPGYIAFKCNLNIIPEEDTIFIDNQCFDLLEGELYCFEASLFKHWLEKSEKERILLSYGFLLSYKELGWDETAPRIRLSQRIWKKFIGK